MRKVAEEKLLLDFQEFGINSFTDSYKKALETVSANKKPLLVKQIAIG